MAEVIVKRDLGPKTARHDCGTCGSTVDFSSGDVRGTPRNESYVVCPVCEKWIDTRDLKFKRPKTTKPAPFTPFSCHCGTPLFDESGEEPVLLEITALPREWKTEAVDFVKKNESSPAVPTRYITRLIAVPNTIVITCPDCSHPHQISPDTFEMEWRT